MRTLLTITLLFSISVSGQLTKAQTSANFDAAYTKEQTLLYDRSTSGDQGDIYYYDYTLDGWVSALIAEGSSRLSMCIELVQNIYDTKAASSTFPSPGTNPQYEYDDAHEGWWDSSTGAEILLDAELNLSDGHGLRNVPKLLYVLYKYPALRAMDNGSFAGSTYQTQYDLFLQFMEDMYDKWWQRHGTDGNGIYRINTHMTSHWAQISLYLYLITNDAKYKTMVDNFFTNMTAGGQSASFMEQLRVNSADANAINWSNGWGNTTGSTDHSHANADVQIMVNAYLLGWYSDTGLSTAFPDLNTDLMDRLGNTLDIVADGYDATAEWKLDGSDNSNFDAQYDDGWSMLGRFNEARQQNLETRDLTRADFLGRETVFWGTMLYNRAYLEGSLVYPEYTVATTPKRGGVNGGRSIKIGGSCAVFIVEQ